MVRWWRVCVCEREREHAVRALIGVSSSASYTHKKATLSSDVLAWGAFWCTNLQGHAFEPMSVPGLMGNALNLSWLSTSLKKYK